MKVTVEGVITSVEQDVKKGKEGFPDKQITKLLLAQKGERQQVEVRLPGHVAHLYSEFEPNTFTGSLMAWTTRDGVGMMVMVQDDAG